MTVEPSLLANAEIFSGLPASSLEDIAGYADLVSYAPGDVLCEPGQPATSLQVIQTGIVGLYVQRPGRLLNATSLLGPGKVVGHSALFPRARWLQSGRALLQTTVVEVPARLIQSQLLRDSTTSMLVHENLVTVMRRRLEDVLKVLRAEEAGVIAVEPCPAGRETEVALTTDPRSEEVRGVCQRQFACTEAQGEGCPLAGKPAHEPHPIWPLQLASTRAVH